MSKEQTLIDFVTEYYAGVLPNMVNDNTLFYLMEQYANAKLLEFAEWEQSDTSHLNYSPKELVDMFTKQK